MRISNCLHCGLPYNAEITGGHICPGPTASTAGRSADLASRIASLETENAKLRKDAERYRWIRRFPVKTHRLLDIGVRKEQLDAAIDAAMENKHD